MITVTRKFEFDAAHRVLGHNGKCRHLHGHRYVAEVTVVAPKLDSLGMAIDFSILKTCIGGFIDTQWDHNILLHPGDPLAILYRNMGDKRIGLADAETEKVMGYIHPIFQGRPPFIFGDRVDRGHNPTAEVLAEYLAGVAQTLLKGAPDPINKIRVTKVRMYETPNCWAEWVLDVEKFKFEPLQVEVQNESKPDQSAGVKFKGGIVVDYSEDEPIKGDTQG